MACLRIEYDGKGAVFVWHFPVSPQDWEGKLKARRWKGAKHLTVRKMPPGNYVVETEGPYYPIPEKHPGPGGEVRIRNFAGTEDETIRPNL